MKICRLARLRDDVRGVAAVEFALILPVLLAILAGLFGFGRALFVEQAVRDLVDQSLRSAVITGATGPALQTNIEDGLAVVPGIGSYSVSVVDGAQLGVTVTGTMTLGLAEMMPARFLSFTLTGGMPR